MKEKNWEELAKKLQKKIQGKSCGTLKPGRELLIPFQQLLYVRERKVLENNVLDPNLEDSWHSFPLKIKTPLKKLILPWKLSLKTYEKFYTCEYFDKDISPWRNLIEEI